jgi:hypothetical protein
MKTGQIHSCELLCSKSGRKLAPAPKINTATSSALKATLRRMNVWLLAEARKEAANDSWTLSLLQGLEVSNLSPSDQDLMNDVVFGDSRGPGAAHRNPA